MDSSGSHLRNLPATLVVAGAAMAMMVVAMVRGGAGPPQKHSSNAVASHPPPSESDAVHQGRGRRHSGTSIPLPQNTNTIPYSEASALGATLGSTTSSSHAHPPSALMTGRPRAYSAQEAGLSLQSPMRGGDQQQHHRDSTASAGRSPQSDALPLLGRGGGAAGPVLDSKRLLQRPSTESLHLLSPAEAQRHEREAEASEKQRLLTTPTSLFQQRLANVRVKPLPSGSLPYDPPNGSSGKGGTFSWSSGASSRHGASTDGADVAWEDHQLGVSIPFCTRHMRLVSEERQGGVVLLRFIVAYASAVAAGGGAAKSAPFEYFPPGSRRKASTPSSSSHASSAAAGALLMAPSTVVEVTIRLPEAAPNGELCHTAFASRDGFAEQIGHTALIEGTFVEVMAVHDPPPSAAQGNHAHYHHQGVTTSTTATKPHEKFDIDVPVLEYQYVIEEEHRLPSHDSMSGSERVVSSYYDGAGGGAGSRIPTSDSLTGISPTGRTGPSFELAVTSTNHTNKGVSAHAAQLRHVTSYFRNDGGLEVMYALDTATPKPKIIPLWFTGLVKWTLFNRRAEAHAVLSPLLDSLEPQQPPVLLGAGAAASSSALSLLAVPRVSCAHNVPLPLRSSASIHFCTEPKHGLGFLLPLGFKLVAGPLFKDFRASARGGRFTQMSTADVTPASTDVATQLQKEAWYAPENALSHFLFEGSALENASPQVAINEKDSSSRRSTSLQQQLQATMTAFVTSAEAARSVEEIPLPAGVLPRTSLQQQYPHGASPESTSSSSMTSSVAFLTAVMEFTTAEPETTSTLLVSETPTRRQVTTPLVSNTGGAGSNTKNTTSTAGPNKGSQTNRTLREVVSDVFSRAAPPSSTATTTQPIGTAPDSGGRGDKSGPPPPHQSHQERDPDENNHISTAFTHAFGADSFLQPTTQDSHSFHRKSSKEAKKPLEHCRIIVDGRYELYPQGKYTYQTVIPKVLRRIAARFRLSESTIPFSIDTALHRHRQHHPHDTTTGGSHHLPVTNETIVMRPFVASAEVLLPSGAPRHTPYAHLLERRRDARKKDTKSRKTLSAKGCLGQGNESLSSSEEGDHESEERYSAVLQDEVGMRAAAASRGLPGAALPISKDDPSHTTHRNDARHHFHPTNGGTGLSAHDASAEAQGPYRLHNTQMVTGYYGAIEVHLKAPRPSPPQPQPQPPTNNNSSTSAAAVPTSGVFHAPAPTLSSASATSSMSHHEVLSMLHSTVSSQSRLQIPAEHDDEIAPLTTDGCLTGLLCVYILAIGGEFVSFAFLAKKTSVFRMKNLLELSSFVMNSLQRGQQRGQAPALSYLHLRPGTPHPFSVTIPRGISVVEPRHGDAVAAFILGPEVFGAYKAARPPPHCAPDPVTHISVRLMHCPSGVTHPVAEHRQKPLLVFRHDCQYLIHELGATFATTRPAHQQDSGVPSCDGSPTQGDWPSRSPSGGIWGWSDRRTQGGDATDPTLCAGPSLYATYASRTGGQHAGGHVTIVEAGVLPVRLRARGGTSSGAGGGRRGAHEEGAPAVIVSFYFVHEHDISELLPPPLVLGGTLGSNSGGTGGMPAKRRPVPVSLPEIDDDSPSISLTTPTQPRTAPNTSFPSGGNLPLAAIQTRDRSNSPGGTTTTVHQEERAVGVYAPAHSSVIGAEIEALGAPNPFAWMLLPLPTSAFLQHPLVAGLAAAFEEHANERRAQADDPGGEGRGGRGHDGDFAQTFAQGDLAESLAGSEGLQSTSTRSAALTINGGSTSVRSKRRRGKHDESDDDDDGSLSVIHRVSVVICVDGCAYILQGSVGRRSQRRALKEAMFALAHSWII